MYISNGIKLNIRFYPKTSKIILEIGLVGL